MKKTINIIFFILFYILFSSKSFAWYEINDLWNIYKNINEINWYNWNIWDLKIGFLWNNYFIINRNWKAVYWYFDEHKKTVITKVDIWYLSKLWYLWNTFSLSWNVLDYKIVKWYFDEHRKTIINKKIPNYNFNLWFLWDVKIVNNKRSKKKIIIQKSYRELLEEYIKQNTLVFALENNINLRDYNIFVWNILDFILEWEDKILFWDDIEKMKIEIAKTDFLNKIRLLIKNTRSINTWFKVLKIKQEKIYMLDYYLK